LKARADGQWVAQVFPLSLDDKLAYAGWTAEVWIEPGKQPTQGAIYRPGHKAAGKLALVLGAGNVSSIGPMDALTKLFVENEVVVLKMNPVNEVSGPYIQRAFQCLIDEDFFGVVYGGADIGKHLTDHPLVETIHMTGSDRTHDAIVWGSSSDEIARNKAAKTPRLKKHVTSELGCVTPVFVVPGAWSEGDLGYQAKHVAGMVSQNGSFNCNAAKVVVTAKGWPLRERFLEKLKDALRATTPRKAYYPGARQRYQGFVDKYPRAEVLGARSDGKHGDGKHDDESVVPWTYFPDVPPQKGEHALTSEAFCGVLAETALDVTTASDFLKAIVPFGNDVVWGTLSCMILIDGATERACAAELDHAVAQLRYGGIAINGWAGALFGLCVTPWGAFPGHPLEDIVSGRGVVHNTFLFDHPQKSVLRMPFKSTPPPPWFPDHANLKGLAEKLTRYEGAPSLAKMPGIALAALRG
jgi:hypothetical protein